MDRGERLVIGSICGLWRKVRDRVYCGLWRKVRDRVYCGCGER